MVDGKELNKILSVLPNPKNKEDMVYYHLFDNVEATAKELVRVSDLSIGGFRNMVKDNPRIIRLRLVNKIAIYGLGEQYREQLKLFLKQAIENKERIEQNKADQEKRAKEESSTEDEKLAIFKEMLKDKNVLLVEGGNYILNIKEIRENYPYVYGLILDEPEQTIQGLEVVMFELGLGEYIRATFKNLDAMQNLKVENYRTEHLGKTICSEVKIESISGIRSLVTNARFECPSCGTIISVLQTQKKFKEPSRCSCGRRGGFKEISKDMVDAAILTVSDINPRSDIPVNKDINCFVKEDLLKQGVIEKLTPGNNIRVVGIFKEIQIEAKAGGHLTRFDWAIEVLGIEEFDPEINSMDFKEEEIKEFDNLSDKIDKDGLAPLIKSYAPEVEGFDIVKQALAIQASQRNNSNIEEESTKSHIGLFGDPGVSKSVLAKFTLGITIGSAYASGGGASGVGLTASVIKVENIGYVLKLGKLPMTKELLVLDEYNLVSDEDKPKLQEAFSEKKITINKAGISASPKVSCGSLCLANPIRGIFDNSQSLRQQFNLTHPQLNRFDALFIEQDEKDEGKDGRIVDIILKRKVGEIKAEYDIKFLRKFFTYTRNRAEPTLTEESQKELKKSYMKARGMTKNNEGVLINPRFLNALIRFATGNAKLRGSSEVLIKDVEVAYNILSASYLNLNKFEALK